MHSFFICLFLLFFSTKIYSNPVTCGSQFQVEAVEGEAEEGTAREKLAGDLRWDMTIVVTMELVAEPAMDREVTRESQDQVRSYLRVLRFQKMCELLKCEINLRFSY